VNTAVTAAQLRAFLHYDHETGVFTWRESRGRVAAGDVAGHIKPDGYRRIRIDGRFYLAHRLAWLWVHGRPMVGECDHINGQPDDNRICNLREASVAVNRQNIRSSHRDSVSRKLGVSWSASSKKYRARIWSGSAEVHLGVFDTSDRAHEAYRDAKRRLHAGCTI
jgi:hypothetical protein